MSDDMIETTGIVMKVDRGDLHHVTVKHGAHERTVLAKRNGRLHKHHIRIVAGDHVLLEVSPYDTTRGRITRRL